MNLTRKSMASIVIVSTVVLLVAIAILWAIHSNKATNTPRLTGSIEIYGKNNTGQPGSVMCTIDVVSGTYKFPHGLCENDQAEHINLINVPSSTTIKFYDTPDCNEKTDQNFYMFFKTTKDRVNSEAPLELKTIIGTPVGNIVPNSGGLRMEKKYENEQVYGKLSCMTIELGTPVP